MVRGHGGVTCSQPVAVMLGGAQELVDDDCLVPTTEQIAGELIEDRPERVGPEPADVMGPLKERVEHGCTPGKVMKSRGEHPDYAEPCLSVAGMEAGERGEERQ